MFTLRRLVALWALFACLVGFAAEAAAQTVILPPTGVKHTRTNRGNLINTRINFDDCDQNDAIDFTVALSAANSALSLQVWAGASCDVQTNRVTSTLLNCWQIGKGFTASQINPPTIHASVRDILYGRTLASGTSTGISTGTGGTTSTTGEAGDTGDTGVNETASGGTGGGTTTTSTSEDACTLKDAATAAQNIIVYFMLVDSGSNIQGTFATFTGSYKLLAPAPPDKVSAGIGENQLAVRFSYDDDSTDTTINGYNIYCDPPPGTKAAKAAGVLPADGGVALTSCDGVPSNNLIAGQHVNGLSAYRCGSAGTSAKGGAATGLVDGVAYHIAVATTDAFDNVGVLSDTACAVPQPVTGFYEAYRDAGGRAGGGFCSFSRRPEPLTAFAVLGVAGCLARRRRRRTT